ncbi:MAG TPA: stage V sporulation protein AC [Firmicutes bacterium]|nr:stage V sporulation protein AC [Bacillota bacterium]
MEHENKEYLRYLDEKAPGSPTFKNIVWAFCIGGLICVIGQAFSNLYSKVCGLSDEDAKTAVSVTMIFLGALFTGLNIYPRIAKYAGAGTIVPITGFANSIVSPAMEFKKEGYVLGMAAKMFVIAGPVLVYGITSSAVVGIIYYIYTLLV